MQSLPRHSFAANFAHIAPDGQAEKVLRVDWNSITYLSTNYTHWKDLRADALEAVELAATEFFYDQGYSVTEAGLQYENRFLWIGSNEDFDATQLIRPDSSWIPPRIYNSKLNWHANCGEFQAIDNGIRRLIRMNTAAISGYQSDPNQRSIILQVSLSDALNMPGFDVSNAMTHAQSEAWIKERLEHLHADEKRIVADIIVGEMQERITLEAHESV
jgi:uncharacterized protein (TIGR04255 family)